MGKDFGASRGGVRGGRDQFDWSEVKQDKYRENYLGHSLKAPVGRWAIGKDLSWYSKEKGDAASASQREIAMIKEKEAEALSAALCVYFFHEAFFRSLYRS